MVPFLDGPALQPGEPDNFFLPTVRRASATLFEHCARGLDGSLAVGSHGLPLIGTGDWNDGMNDVGAAGRGESVWLGWFLHFALSAFAAARRGAGRTWASRDLARARGRLAVVARAAWLGRRLVSTRVLR